MSTKVSITFVGGARKVTGSNFLVEATKNDVTTRILIDCGLEQGGRFCESSNNEPFPYDPATIDAVFFTHAHIDHIGLYPKLVKDGFKGNAYATEATAALMAVMLEDGASLIGREAKKCDEEPPYTTADVERAVSDVKGVGYKETVQVADGINVTLYNAGHILGSSLVLLDVWGTKLLFSGDLGRTPGILIPDMDIPDVPIDYLITESVYGNRVHESAEESEAALLKALQNTVNKKGTLLIPSFSLERTQIILAAIDRFMKEKLVEPLPVFLDSPLAIRVTEVYKKHPEYLRESLQKMLKNGDDPFSFPSLRVTYSHEESKTIDDTPAPKVIIAGAGMSHGGRVRSHERTYLPDANSSLLLVGYQVPGSLGRRLQDGAKSVTIDRKKVKVRASVSKTGGFSAHADRDGLLAFVEKVKPKKTFVVLGEMDASSFLAQRISGFLGIESVIPQKGERIDLI